MVRVDLPLRVPLSGHFRVRLFLVPLSAICRTVWLAMGWVVNPSAPNASAVATSQCHGRATSKGRGHDLSSATHGMPMCPNGDREASAGLERRSWQRSKQRQILLDWKLSDK